MIGKQYSLDQGPGQFDIYLILISKMWLILSLQENSFYTYKLLGQEMPNGKVIY